METLQKNTQKEIGQYVADDFRTAAIFSKYKIDFAAMVTEPLPKLVIKKGLIVTCY